MQSLFVLIFPALHDWWMLIIPSFHLITPFILILSERSRLLVFVLQILSWGEVRWFNLFLCPLIGSLLFTHKFKKLLFHKSARSFLVLLPFLNWWRNSYLPSFSFTYHNSEHVLDSGRLCPPHHQRWHDRSKEVRLSWKKIQPGKPCIRPLLVTILARNNGLW